MKRNKIVNISSVALILFSAFAFLSVSLMAFGSPQSVMDLVQVKLSNNDAYSSIRGVYGGVGLAIVIALLYLAIKNTTKGLQFLALLWGLYALSRIMTIITEGELGAFGQQWLMIESLLCGLSLLLLVLRRNGKNSSWVKN